MTLVKEVEILLIIGEQVGEYESHKHYKLRDWFHNLLACSVLCRVTVKVGLDPDSKYSWNNVPKDIIPSERESKWLDAILNVTTGVYQELKGKLRQELKFKTNNLCIGARIKAWEQKCMGKTAVEVTGAVVLGEEGPSEGASF